MRLNAITEDHKYTIAIDLDGTLAIKDIHYTKEILEPMPDAAEVMGELEKLPVMVIINTVRGNKNKIKTWLKKHDFIYDHINHNPDQPDGSSHKIIADEYWDDRAVGWPGLRIALTRLQRKLNG